MARETSFRGANVLGCGLAASRMPPERLFLECVLDARRLPMELEDMVLCMPVLRKYPTTSLKGIKSPSKRQPQVDVVRTDEAFERQPSRRRYFSGRRDRTAPAPSCPRRRCGCRGWWWAITTARQAGRPRVGRPIWSSSTTAASTGRPLTRMTAYGRCTAREL